MLVLESTTTFSTPYFAAYSSTALVPSTLNWWCSACGKRGSCTMAMWMSAFTSPLRKISSTLRLRMSSWKTSRSLGGPGKVRRSRPSTRPVRCRSLVSVRPRFPLMPVMRTPSRAMARDSSRPQAPLLGDRRRHRRRVVPALHPSAVARDLAVGEEAGHRDAAGRGADCVDLALELVLEDEAAADAIEEQDAGGLPPL